MAGWLGLSARLGVNTTSDHQREPWQEAAADTGYSTEATWLLSPLSEPKVLVAYVSQVGPGLLTH